ncbi:putative F-box associated interaction domain-containing protein [Medicago truncatula]|uniref:F-box protein interaction domain protein n=1 Tax=Medicago truncatula TaxID=3880 RepID=A0A072TZM3_MEDTR|nr:F-box protein interaction domain protein [Medicago truncatula]RHN40083.1 putative F-box associated interaction domain-containing protein [Medicago truncatula]
MADATDKKKVSTPSHIHDDIALSILSKLPLKSLTRFTCAKKPWSLLFQNPHFMNLFRTNFISKHNEEEDNKNLLLDYDTLCTFSGESFENRVRLELPPPLHFQREGCPFVRCWCSASVNGILCLSQGFIDPMTIVLWNPANGEFKIVPCSHRPYKNIEFNTQPYSFGYDRVRDDYKIIRMVNFHIFFEGAWVFLPEKNSPFWEMDLDFDDDDDFWKGVPINMYDPDYWEIYSLRSNSWRKLDGGDIPMPDSWEERCQVNLNEFCYWLNLDNDMGSFDFINEIFFVTNLPSFDFSKETSLEGVSSIYDFNRRKLEKKLVVLNGSVAFICTVLMTSFSHIWVLGEHGVKESWTKLFVVGPLPDITRPIAVGIKSVLFYIKEDTELACFDLSTQRIEEIWVNEEPQRLQIITYKKNLLSFGVMNN